MDTGSTQHFYERAEALANTQRYGFLMGLVRETAEATIGQNYIRPDAEVFLCLNLYWMIDRPARSMSKRLPVDRLRDDLHSIWEMSRRFATEKKSDFISASSVLSAIANLEENHYIFSQDLWGE